MGNPIEGYLDRRHLPEHATPLRLLGVDYAHLPTPDGGDLYVTWHGIHLIEHLHIENWYERDWFQANRTRLRGTGTVYKLRTKPVNGCSADLVVKYCRVGEDVPMDPILLRDFAHAEFNTPYEEFSRVMDLRSRRGGPRILTHRPLGIYVPAKRLPLWQTGRDQSKIATKKARYLDVELDIFRQYVLIYEWIKGVGADEAFHDFPERERQQIITQLTERARINLEQHGYEVMDHKPTHVIVRPRKDGSILRARDGKYAYALVDFELLSRTPEYRHDVRASRRAVYLKRQRERFRIPLRPETFPEHLKPATILGVDYVFGRAESTGGRLWVAGHDPELFDYFLPERWRHTPGKRLSITSESHYTRTKDNVNLVWKLSRVGEQPEPTSSEQDAGTLASHGFNSPFEEFSIALDLARKGIPVTYPRAIYMSGLESSRADLYVVDPRRFEFLRELVTEHGRPLFRPDHNYLTIWGYWNGVAEMEVETGEKHLHPIDLARALAHRIISESLAEILVGNARTRLRKAGYRDLSFLPSHLLLSRRHDKSFICDADNLPTVRLCNFELMQPLRNLDPANAGHARSTSY
jgi:hypothetical protein